MSGLLAFLYSFERNIHLQQATCRSDRCKTLEITVRIGQHNKNNENHISRDPELSEPISMVVRKRASLGRFPDQHAILFSLRHDYQPVLQAGTVPSAACAFVGCLSVADWPSPLGRCEWQLLLHLRHSRCCRECLLLAYCVEKLLVDRDT